MVEVTAYDVVLDLAADDKTFTSLTTITFTSRGGDTFVDLKATHVNRITLDGSEIRPDLVERGRLPITAPAGEHQLVVDAVMPSRTAGAGRHPPGRAEGRER